jgi:ketosteroid isomerase-like protein
MTVPFVQRFLDRVVAQDTTALADMLDPEVVWFGTRGGLDESQVMRGPAAVLDYMVEIQEPWEEFGVEVEQVIEADDGVVVLMRETGRSRHGGPEVHNYTAMIFKVRQERVFEITGYLDRDEALRAAGAA